MKWLQPVLYLLLCGVIEEFECKVFTFTDPPDLMNRTTDNYRRPSDFRCFGSVLTGDFNFNTHYINIGYALNLEHYDKIGCTNSGQAFYPILKGLDPMMPYYINNLHRGIPLARESDAFMGRMTPLQRTKEYCATMSLVAAAYLQYWESFHSEPNLCMNMVDFIKICHEFRQMRELFAAKLYDKLCLSEDGCYNVMEYYEEDLPFCVKYTATYEFQNSSVGSWHHTIINYCKLTEMVPEAKAEKYDRSILTQKGRTNEKLGEMCRYLRYRLLPEEGKEQEIPDEMDDYDTSDIETTTGKESQFGVSIFITTTFRNLIFIAIAYAAGE